MKVIRYSLYGFKPQIQDHHMEQIKYHLGGKFNLSDYPDFMRYEVGKIHNEKVKFYTDHLDDFKSGIWCFIDGHKENISLNHLNRKVPCWEAELPDNTECYDCNWSRMITISDPIVLCGGCYIPERELWKLSNVKSGGSQMGRLTRDDLEV